MTDTDGTKFDNAERYRDLGRAISHYHNRRGLTQVQLGLWIQRGQRSLGGWNPKEGSALKWQEESNETGGFVAHDFAGKV